MIYTPQKNPDEALMLIAVVSFVGILGGIFVDQLIIVVALIFWLQYTAILTYLQFKHRHKHHEKGLTGLLLRPYVRFFVFAFLASLGIFAAVQEGWAWVGALSLVAWFLFSLNFYRYYMQFRKYDD